MLHDVVIPQMGESVLEGTILEWKVKAGETVKLNQTLVELMTDKVNIEIPAEVEGTIKELLAETNEVVPVGAVVARIDDGKGGTATASAPAAEPAKAQASASSATTTTATATATAIAEPPAQEVKATGKVGKGKMAPKTRMLIREYGIDPATITPTGKDGLVTKDDVLRAVDTRSAAAGFTAAPIPSPPAPMMPAPKAAPTDTVPKAPAEPAVKVEIPVFEPLPENLRETREPLAGVRKLISDHMMHSITTSAHVTTFEDIDMTALVDFRKEIKADFVATYGANITYMPFIIKAACVALKEYPKINASMTDKEIIYKNFYNVGIAVARDDGLIVPVIKDADKKTIVELAVEISRIGEKARKNQLMPDDVSGGTFTVTNAGMFGATASTPIISQPQVAILGIHNIVKKPWVIDDEIVIRHISSFGMSFDHRLIDGHTAVQFLHRVHEMLANPAKMMMSLR